MSILARLLRRFLPGYAEVADMVKEVERVVEPEEPVYPLTHKAVEHQQAQMRSAIEQKVQMGIDSGLIDPEPTSPRAIVPRLPSERMTAGPSTNRPQPVRAVPPPRKPR